MTIRRTSSLLCLFFLPGCDSSPDPAALAALQYQQEPEYLVGTVFQPSVFSSAFEAGHVQVDEHGTRYEFHPINAGNLKMPSGQLVITEPLYFYDQEATDIRLKPGSYSVDISEALIIDDGKVVDKRNAFAKITLQSGKAVSWEYVWSFGVDGGTGGYIDYQPMKQMIVFEQQDAFAKQLLDEFEKTYRFTEPFHEHHQDYHQFISMDYADGNLIAFSTGWGDGGYNSYIGYDAQGRAIEVLSDLGVALWDPEKSLVYKGTGESKATSLLPDNAGTLDQRIN